MQALKEKVGNKQKPEIKMKIKWDQVREVTRCWELNGDYKI